MSYTKFYNNPQFSDLQLVDATGRTFYAHRIILAHTFILSLSTDEIGKLYLEPYLLYLYGKLNDITFSQLFNAWIHRGGFEGDSEYITQLLVQAETKYIDSSDITLFPILLSTTKSRMVIARYTKLEIIKELELNQVHTILASNEPLSLNQVRFLVVWLWYHPTEENIDDLLENIPVGESIITLLNGFSSIPNLKFLQRLLELSLHDIKFDRNYLPGTTRVKDITSSYQLEEGNDMPALDDGRTEISFNLTAPLNNEVKNMLAGMLGLKA